MPHTKHCLIGEGEAPTLMDPVEDNGEYSSSGGVNMDGTKLGGGGESDGGMFSNTVAPTTDQGLQNEVHDTGGNWEHTYNEGKQKNNCDTFVLLT